MLLWARGFSSGLFPDWFGYVWQDLCCCISVTSRFFFFSPSLAPFQHLLASYLCSGELEWGACRLRAYLFTLRASSIVPPTSFDRFFTFLCVVVLGTGHWARHMGASCGISESVWSGAAGILSYSTYRLLHMHLSFFFFFFYSGKLNSRSVITLSFYTELKPDNFLFLHFCHRFTVEWSHPLPSNPFHYRNRPTSV